MAMDILNLIKTEGNGLLSKIQIGGKVYEIKDLVARENIEALALLIDALDLSKADKDQVAKDIAAAIAGKADKDQVALDIAAAVTDMATKTQVAKDIADAVKAEADIARAAEKELADDIVEINALLHTVSDEDSITSLKELANWVETHGGEAAEMAKSIKANADAIAKEAEDRAAADAALDERLGDVEALLTGGEGSVGEQIEAAKNAAIGAAKDYTDGEIDKVEAELAKKEDKANLKALAYKDSATGAVAGQTISGVKANGQSAGSITVELQATEKDTSAAGKFTPAGNVTGTVQTAGSIAVTAKHEDTAATLTKGDYTPAGDVSVSLSGASFNAITGVGTQASFVEGVYHAATLDYAAADYSVAKEGIVGTVDGECLTFTAAGLEAISASKINGFNGGSKDADQFTANSLPTMAAQTVGVASASFTGTKAEDLVVTGVSYKKADIDTATFTGAEVDIAATFAGTEGDIAVAGKCKDYAVKTAQFNPAAVELSVGDIVVTEKNVTVQ